MEKKVKIFQGIVSGYDKELIEKILPQLSDSFTQRKEFWEYYFTPKSIKLSLEDIENISKEFLIEISWDSLVIQV